MIQEVLKSIEGVTIFPLIGLFLFVGGFIVIMVTTWRMKPGDVEYISRLPLDDSDTESGGSDSREVGRKEK
jgi:hypothetical protein